MSSSLDAPLEVRLARGRVATARSKLEERLATAGLRGTTDMEVARLLKDLLDLQLDVERAWRESGEEARRAAAFNARAADDLRGALGTARADLVELGAGHAKLQAAHNQLQRDLTGVGRDGDVRLARASEAREAELAAWKGQYTAQMREYVQGKLAEARAAAAREQQAAIDGACGRLEAEYTQRAAAGGAALAEARRAELAAKREAGDARRRMEVAEARASSLGAENEHLRATLAEVSAREGEHREGARQLADEVLRLKGLLDLERRGHEEVSRIHAMKLATEVEAARAQGAGAAAAAADSARVEVERLSRAFEMGTRSREELIAAWRGKYGAMAQRAEAAESLLREIDRHLLPAGEGGNGSGATYGGASAGGSPA
jgi:hypothetical protein